MQKRDNSQVRILYSISCELRFVFVPKIRVRDFCSRIFRRNPPHGEASAIAATMRLVIGSGNPANRMTSKPCPGQVHPPGKSSFHANPRLCKALSILAATLAEVLRSFPDTESASFTKFRTKMPSTSVREIKYASPTKISSTKAPASVSRHELHPVR